MTILAGFACRDGFVLGSDSEETRGLLKVPVPKIEVLEAKHFKFVIAGAGDADLITLAVEQVALRMSNAKLRIGHLRDILTESVTCICDKHVDPKNPDAPSLTLLSATWATTGGAELVRTSNGKSVPIRQHETVGYGQDLASYLIATLYSDQHATVNEMRRLAAYVLKQTKTYAGFCGGDSQIYCLGLDGAVQQMTAEQIFEEERAASVATSTNRFVFYANDPELAIFTTSTENLITATKKLRERFDTGHQQSVKQSDDVLD